VEPKSTCRPGDDFYAKYPHRDVPFADFPDPSVVAMDELWLGGLAKG
jgi:hypothetical protein